MKRLLLDSMIHDFLVEAPQRMSALTKLVERGDVELVSTHIQADEIARTPDAEKRERLQRVPTRPTPTAGIVLDVSRLDMSAFADAGPIEAVRRGNPKHTEDALIAATALREDLVLVTNDHVLSRRATDLGVEVWNSAVSGVRSR
jgi:predicted nucleic acid-binding protein